jgi:hypothetical protein
MPNPFRQTVSFLTTTFILLVVSSCNKEPFSGINIVVDPQLMEYTAVVEIYDAKDREALAVVGDNLQVTFESVPGSFPASEVLNNNGKRIYDIIDGRMSIGLHPRVNIAPSEIKSVMMRITADGYQDKTTYLYFRESLKSQTVFISMINLEAPPSGVGTSDTSISLGSGGTTSTPVVISTANPTPGGGTTNQNVEIAIPSGTQFKNDAGVVVTGSDLKVQVASFDARDSNALVNFPGGFAPNGVLNLPGSGGNRSDSNEIYFQTAGFTAVDMTVSNVPIRSFNQPINISVDVDSLTINPNTGNPVQVSDSLPIWSYDNETARWSYERVGVITRDSSGKMKVSFPTTHLSWFNLDWYGARCASPTRLQVNIPNLPSGVKQYFWIEIVHAGTNQLVTQWAANNQYIGNGEVIDFLQVPFRNTANRVVNMEAKIYRSPSKTQLLATSSQFSCGMTQPVTVNIPAPPPPVSLDVTGVCANKSYVQFRPSFPLYYKASTSTGPYDYLGYVINGVFSTTSLNLGSTYKFRSYFNGQTLDSTMTINQPNFQYTIEMGSYCDNF